MSFNGKPIRAMAHDYETTGTDAWGCGVIESALLILTLEQDGTYVVHDQDVQLMNPGQEIHPEASKVHGYYAIDLIDKPAWEVYMGEQMLTVNEMHLDALIGYNSCNFDNPIAGRAGLKLPPSIDLIKAVRKFKTDHKWPNAKLTTAHEILLGRELVGAHGALADVVGTMDMIVPAMKLAGVSTVDDFAVWMKGDEGTPKMKIGFGKHKGSQLKHLPAAYIDWLLGPKCEMNLTAEMIEGLNACRL